MIIILIKVLVKEKVIMQIKLLISFKKYSHLYILIYINVGRKRYYFSRNI